MTTETKLRHAGRAEEYVLTKTTGVRSPNGLLNFFNLHFLYMSCEV